MKNSISHCLCVHALKGKKSLWCLQAKDIILTIAQAFQVAHEHHVEAQKSSQVDKGSENAHSEPIQTTKLVVHENPAVAGNSPPTKLSKGKHSLVCCCSKNGGTYT